MIPWPKRFFDFFARHQSLAKSLTIPSAPQASQTIHRPRPEPISAPSNTPKVRVVFMGTPSLSAIILNALLDKKYNIVGVVTQPDKGVGRKNEIQESAVKILATERNLPLFQPEKLDPEAIATLKNWKPDLMVVAAYGKILPAALLALPGFSCVNVHTSLLPKWRGASPIQNAILAGETETGVTIMLMDRGMDTGDILTQSTIAIDPDETTPVLTEKLTTLATELLLETLPQWVERRLTPQKQDSSVATLCQLIEREDGRILWTDEAESIYNRYRALTPWPGVFTYYNRDNNLLRLKIITLSCQKMNASTVRPLGTVFEIGEKIGVQTTRGIIFLEVVQLEGKTPVSIQDFIRGDASFVGTLLQ